MFDSFDFNPLFSLRDDSKSPILWRKAVHPSDDLGFQLTCKLSHPVVHDSFLGRNETRNSCLYISCYASSLHIDRVMFWRDLFCWSANCVVINSQGLPAHSIRNVQRHRM